MNNLMQMAIMNQATIADWWDDCSALLHFPNFVSPGWAADQGPLEHTGTINGGVSYESTTVKFGDGAVDFTRGTSDYLSYPNHSSFELGAGDFTFDCQLRIRDTGKLGMFSKTVSATNRMIFGYDSGTFTWYHEDSGGSCYETWTKTLSIDTWYHIALVRDGNDYELFVDGVSQGTNADSRTISTMATTLDIGRYYFGGYEYSNAIMDEVRLLKGNALWTSNFTAPTKEYSKYE